LPKEAENKNVYKIGEVFLSMGLRMGKISTSFRLSPNVKSVIERVASEKKLDRTGALEMIGDNYDSSQKSMMSTQAKNLQDSREFVTRYLKLRTGGKTPLEAATEMGLMPQEEQKLCAYYDDLLAKELSPELKAEVEMTGMPYQQAIEYIFLQKNERIENGDQGFRSLWTLYLKTEVALRKEKENSTRAMEQQITSIRSLGYEAANQRRYFKPSEHENHPKQIIKTNEQFRRDEPLRVKWQRISPDHLR
jgi:hypothetical protein